MLSSARYPCRNIGYDTMKELVLFFSNFRELSYFNDYIWRLWWKGH